MQTSGLDHIVLTVSSVERSRKFYEEVLGFEMHTFPSDYSNNLYAGSCYFVVGGVEITLIEHEHTQPGDQFSEFRIGLDHLSFRAPDESALEALVDTLINAGIATPGIEVYAPNGKKYVSFRDPNNIQLEYWLNET